MPSPRSRLRFASIALCLGLVLAACGDDGGEANRPPRDGLGCGPVSVERGEAPEAPEPTAEAPTEVVTEDIEVGEGCVYSFRPYAAVDMIGVTGSGHRFIDTWADERSLSVGAGDLLESLEVALTDLAVGGIRRVDIPAAEGYGAEGFEAQGVGPDEPLHFVVKLTEVGDSRTWCREAQPLPAADDPGKPTEVPLPVRFEKTVGIEDIEVGDGPEAAVGDQVTLHYVGVSCGTGEQFDSSWDRGETMDVVIGSGQVIRGFDQGLRGVQAGTVRVVSIPADLAYGNNPNPDSAVLPGDNLVFHLTIEAVGEPTVPDTSGDIIDGGEVIVEPDGTETETETETEAPAGDDAETPASVDEGS